LFRHQAAAIAAAVAGQHCSVCTGTGSGKSLCFLIPVLAAAYNENCTSLLLFPTKALAQDQLSKLQTMLQQTSSNSDDNDLAQRIRPMTIDGDTSHAARAIAAETANVILTNPDTLHAAILPS
jgi:DEAD/DEAH box helicase domain-containing protein